MSTQDSINLFNTFHQYTNVLADQTQLIKNRLIAAQDISEGFENIIASPHYSAFLEYGIPKFIQTLRDGEPQFVSETTEQEFRKLLLEIIHRIPTNEQLKPFVKPILTLMFELLEIENEENVLVALRVIIELHKQYRPQMQPEIQTFLSFVKGMYKELPNNAKVHFVVVSVGPDGLLPAENLDSVQGVIGNVNSGGKVPESPSASDVGGKSQSNCIPKATSSLKVLSELPIIVVLMYQLYKQNVHGVISDFIALVMNTITLQPTMAARKLPNFNKEVYVDFTAAQIKTLSILAYFVKIFQELVAQASQNLVGGMLGLFRYCPQEVAHLRKELLIAAKHILGTELRAKFVPHIEQLFDEEVLIGSGWTVNEGLRPLAYSTLADFVHHVRSLLSLPNLALAVHLFSKNVHDESLLISIQRMSCKLLLNLVDCIRQKSDEQGVGREILMKMLEVFVRKFKTTAKHHIPAILEKCQPSDSVTVASTKTDEKPSSLLLESTKEKTVSWRGSGSKDNLSVADYREMVKTLVCGVKTITWGAGSCKLTTGDVQIPVYPQGNKVFLPSETKIFIRLLKYALEALDVYQISVNPTGNGFIKMANSPQQIRMKEEKEILEHFAGVFTMLNTATFKEVFTATIEYLVDRIHSNYALQIIPNSFLANPHTSATFATILVRFLLNKLENMGTKSEKSNLYLKLFKLVFGSVSLFAQENEQMLKPHLHEIVNRSMELAMSAKEPYNYFLLLRALFRSIGGGSHDLLYQEFLPLLPNLLQGLNNLQSGIHKQYMKDLFVELCLTVPVRLSSLLPYLPMLMDPLVSALNGTQTLVSQGLRTLELCVDNLQPDFLYDHIQPVRADLMQALWRTLRNTVETIAHVAFRVLGKFGGASRRMLKEPQKLTYQQSENIGPCLLLSFLDTEDDVPLPVASVIERAGNVLKTPKPNVSNVNQQNNVAYDNLPFYRQQAWFIVKYFIVAAMSLEDNTAFLEKLAQDEGFKTKALPVTGKPCVAPCADEQSKKTFQQALSGMLFAAATTELQDDSLPFMAGVLRHFALVTVVQQAGSFAYITQTSITGMDVHIIIDSIADIMSHEDKDLCKTGELAIQIIFETIAIVLQDKLKASQLPFFEYMIEKLCGCCYERAWFAKAGGCMAVKFLLDFMPLQWLLEHQPTFITALMFVMMDLTNEVSSGTVEAAKTILIDLLKKCNCDLKDEDLTKVQTRVFPHVVQHMVREVVSPNHTVRAQARNALDVLSQLTGKSVHSLMEPHKALLEDMIPPKKHLLRHQPANTQIALMDGNTFCTSLSPRLFTMDLTIIEHKVFFTELYTLCEADDSQLTKLPCYKNVPSFAQLRISALAALTSCHYIVQAREKIFNVLVKAINSSVPEVMEAGKENMRKFINGGALDSVKDHVRVNIRPLLLLLGDFRSLNMSVLQKLTCFMELFPDLFNEKLCEQLLAHLTRWTEAAKAAANTQTQQQIKPALRSSEEVKICAAIMNMFQLVPAASSKLIEPLVQLTVKIERALILEVGSPFREPLIKFLMRYPSHTADFFLMNIANPLMNRFFIYMLNREDAKPLRVAVEANPLKLVNSTFSANIAQPQTADEQSTVSKKRQELQFQGILIIRTLVEHNGGWLAQQPVLIGHLRRIWMNEASFEKGKKNETSISSRRWREPKLLAKCLLNYVKHRPNEVELLFQILRIFTIRTIPDFHFLSKFLDDITKEYKIEQKRNVFFKFADCFLDHNYAQELKAMILQHIIIPLFKTSFEGGQVDQLIGGPPNPDHDSNDNVISVFINKVIDPQSPFATSDSVRILLLQFSALLVEYAAPHIHDAANKKQGNKLRRLFQYAWPCLLPKQCVDPATKYHGHYLHAQIISKFAIHKKFVLQVFHGLLKAHAQEARTIVRQALDILTPVMPHRMEDGNQMLSHWTKKIIVEEGHTIGQLVHMLHLVVRHHEVYYPVRKDLVPHMVNSMQRLGFNSNATIDQRKLAVDLAEIVTEWEKRNSKEQIAEMAEIGTKRSISDSTSEPYPKRICTPGQNTRQATAAERALKNTYPFRIEKTHTDSVCNFLFRIASQVNDASSTGSSPGEALSRRCFKILKNALQPDCWPNTDLRVTWLDKLFNMMDQTPNANYGNVCTALEILAYLCTVLPKDDLLAIFKPLQRGIVSCMACQNMKVVKSVNGLLLRLLTVFPIDQGTGQPKQDDLDYLYNNIGSSIYEGLLSYERSANSATNIIYGPLMLLKAACGSSPTYIDKFMVQFMKALNRMQKDHVAGQQGESGGLTEMLILSLELVKNRMGAMHGDLRRIFLSTFTTLIEKSPEAKLLKSMTKIVDEWMKIKPIQNSQHHCPSIREKSVILYRMMLNFEKRFSDDLELHAQFLEIVNHIYRDSSLMGSELTARLEPAFLAGLRSVQPHIRIKFMEVFDRGIKKRLYDRLMFIIATQNWEHMGNHFWIKQCLEIMFAVANQENQVKCSSIYSKLPSVKSILRQSSLAEAQAILKAGEQTSESEGDTIREQAVSSRGMSSIAVKQEPVDPDEPMETDDDGKEKKETVAPEFYFKAKTAAEILAKFADGTNEKEKELKEASTNELASNHGAFLEELRRQNTGPCLSAIAQLCHRSTLLAHKIWVDLFPRIWDLLEEKYQGVIAGELGPFLCSGSHLHQSDCFKSSVNTLVEGMSNCTPPIPVRPIVLKYLGKTHNLWHRSALLLEEASVACEDMISVNPQLPIQQPWLDYGLYDEEVSELPVQETFDSLAEIYSMLSEDDMWSGLMHRKARFPETYTAIAYEQQGLFEQAQKAFETAMAKAREQYNNGKSDPRMLSEYALWEQHWIRAAKELGQWDILMEFGKSKGQQNPMIVLESAWRIPDWTAMKEALTQVEMSSPDSMAYRLTLYRGFIAICHPDEQHQHQPALIEKLVETATAQAIRQWRRLPAIVTDIHAPLLRTAQQIMELQEASQVHVGLQPQNIGRVTNLHDMKAIVKTWRNRLPLQCDDLVHWSDVFMWRHHHYQAIVAAYENLSSTMPDTQSSNHAMLGVHASAWSIIHYGHVARKHDLTGVCLDSLSRIHTIPSVPIVDCFHKIREQVKCYLQMAGVMGKQELQEGLEVIESTNLRYFSKEMTAEFFALKGMFLAQVNRSEEANKAFSEAVQMHDTLVKAWALWGDYLDNLFVNERNITTGAFAIICYMHACRSQNESKCRKYLARTLWLLSYDDEKGSLAESLEKYCVGVPSAHWLPWIPQLLTCFVRKEGSRVLNLIFSVARVFPQAVYFPIRTLYLTLKIEQREKHRMERRQSLNGENKPGINASENEKKGEQSSSTSTVVSTPSTLTTVTSKADTTSSSQDAAGSSSTATPTTATTSATISLSEATPNVTTPSSQSIASTNVNTTTPASGGSANSSQNAGSSEAGMIRAPAPMMRCSKIMHMMRDLHPTLLSALEGIVDQMVWFRECWHEEVLRQLRQGLTKCYQVAFDHRGDVNGAQITPRTLTFVKKLVSTFGIGFESGSSVYSSFSSSASESLARRAQATAQDPVFLKLKEQFVEDFDFSKPGSIKLHKLIVKLRKWIRILEAKTKLLPGSFLLEERCRFLSNFSQATAEVELPGEFLMPKTTIHNAFYVRIAKFMPKVELVHRHNFSARRLTIRGHNGKLYPYLVVNDAWLTESRREERVLQLLRMVNLFLEKRKATARRQLQFNVPRVVAVSPQMRLIEDNPSIISLTEIYRERCQRKKIDCEAAIAHYYDRLGSLQASGFSTNHQVLRDILKEVQLNLISDNMVKEWATYTYPNATDFWTFRKLFTQQVALAGFVEFTFHLTRLNPEMINVARDCGHVTFNFFKFDLDDSKGELDANRPVPFRLTPNMCELISPVGVSGIITHCMIAVARCLVQPQFSIASYFKAILKDEMLTWHKKKNDEALLTNSSVPSSEMDGELLITMVTNATNAIITRLQNLAQFENAESKVGTLISAAMNPDNLCRMDPAWNPWL